jgi:hypothetical protein
VAALAGLVALLAFVYSFFMNREIYPDELGFYNPICMCVHHNKMTYRHPARPQSRTDVGHRRRGAGGGRAWHLGSIHRH